MERDRSLVENQAGRAKLVMTPPEGSHNAKRLEDLLAQLLTTDHATAARVEAANQLAERQDPQAVMALLEIVKTEVDVRLLMHVIGLLARHRMYSAVDPIIALILCSGETAIEAELDDFRHSDTGVRLRISAIQALGRMGDSRAIMPLMRLLGLQAENYRIRLAAAESLGRLGDSQALNPLINIVEDEQETSVYLKESAVKALGMLGDIRALSPLLDIFESRKGWMQKFSFLKEQIVEAIGRLGSNENRAQQALLEALEDEGATIRLSAVESLAEIGDHSCIVAIKKRLFDADDDVAVAAASTLYQLGGEDLIREILKTQDNLPQFIREELESYVP